MSAGFLNHRRVSCMFYQGFASTEAGKRAQRGIERWSKKNPALGKTSSIAACGALAQQRGGAWPVGCAAARLTSAVAQSRRSLHRLLGMLELCSRSPAAARCAPTAQKL